MHYIGLIVAVDAFSTMVALHALSSEWNRQTRAYYSGPFASMSERECHLNDMKEKNPVFSDAFALATVSNELMRASVFARFGDEIGSRRFVKNFSAGVLLLILSAILRHMCVCRERNTVQGAACKPDANGGHTELACP